MHIRTSVLCSDGRSFGMRIVFVAAIVAVLLAALCASLCVAQDAWAKSGPAGQENSNRLAAYTELGGSKFTAVEGKNITGKANVVELFGFGEGHLGSSKMDAITTETISGYDVTGDGWADRFRATITPQDLDDGQIESVSNLRFYVNGLIALDIDSFHGIAGRPFSPEFTVELITLKNRQSYLLVTLDDPTRIYPESTLYHYQDGALVEVLNSSDFARMAGIRECTMSARPYGNNVDVSYMGKSSFLNRVRITMPYGYDKSTGGLKLRGNAAMGVAFDLYADLEPKSANEDYTLSNKTLICMKPFKANLSPSDEDAVFTVGKGALVRIDGAILEGETLYYKIGIVGGKTGYTNADKGLLGYSRYGVGGWFEEAGV